MIYDRIVRPALFRLDPERAHSLALSVLTRTPAAALLGGERRAVDDPVRLWGLEFRNRLGLAAGFDKNAVALASWHALGFGFVEIGTATRHPQPGNPRPRVFRCVGERGLVNRMGFPNDGAERIAERLRRFAARGRPPRFPVAANIGKSKVTPLEEAEEDYVYSLRALREHADLFVVNVSSPNTPGLRELQSPERLAPILKRLRSESRAGDPRPLLVKIAPDLTDGQIAEIAGLAVDLELDGIVATNTTIDHGAVALEEQGGLSGLPLRQRSTNVIRRIAAETGDKLPIIGVGGVFTRDDYLEKLDAGAALVEVYTGFVYRGPRIAWSILKPEG